MAAIRTIYPNAPEPVFMTRSRWKSDPFSRGSYSFNAVGVVPATAFSSVIGPFNGARWVFAGEHTSRTYYGTMTGAYQTGQSSVDLVSTMT
jgi:monoamine oxidase